MRPMPTIVAVLAACKPAPTPLSSSRSPGAIATSPYSRLFVDGACFRYRAVHRELLYEEDGPKVKRDRSTTAEIRCCVANTRQFAAATASRVDCSHPSNITESELVGNPPIGPVVPASRVYVATSTGLWSRADTMPATEADVVELASDPQAHLVARPLRALYDKNVEDEDVSFTMRVERDDRGRWCWERVERDDYVISETLCFADGALVHSRRVHDVEESIDTTTLDLIE